ncbi:MAG TPA: hypothetical protein VM689_07065 [Aliidongia sp.]|nr:hypothetical protein [Aliidongia sp.]
MLSDTFATRAKKRAELAGQIDQAKCTLSNLISDLDAIDRAIRIFDPEMDVVSIPAKWPKAIDPVRLGGDIVHSVLDIMRSAGVPVSVNEIAKLLLIDRYMSTNDERVAKAARKRVYSALRQYMARRW